MNKIEIFELVASKVVYCKDSGRFTWQKRDGFDPATKAWNTQNEGKESGGIDKSNGYRKITVSFEGKPYAVYSHRLAWFIVYGVTPSGQIDHIDHDKTNNKISNLRDVSRSANQRNKLMHKNNTSGVTGVAWHGQRKKWVAYGRLKDTGKRKHIGLFDDIGDAEKAVIAFRKEHGYTDTHGMKPNAT